MRTWPLHYPGDVRGMVGGVVGPDAHGGLYRAIGAEHPVPTASDPAGTRVLFRVLTADELAAYVGARPLPPLTPTDLVAVVDDETARAHDQRVDQWAHTAARDAAGVTPST